MCVYKGVVCINAAGDATAAKRKAFMVLSAESAAVVCEGRPWRIASDGQRSRQEASFGTCFQAFGPHGVKMQITHVLYHPFPCSR